MTSDDHERPTEHDHKDCLEQEGGAREAGLRAMAERCAVVRAKLHAHGEGH